MSGTASRNIKQLKALEYLVENAGQTIELDAFAAFCEWKPDTAKTHISKKLRKYVTLLGEKRYEVSQDISLVTPENFIKIMSQVDTVNDTSQEAIIAEGELHPFSELNLTKLFRREQGNPQKLEAAESYCLEYKENFSWKNKAKYGKAMAGLANASGGYILFGIRDNREVTGLSSSSFDDAKTEIITNYLNSYFSPEIKWDKITVIDRVGYKIGIIYVFEGQKKPFVSIGSDDVIKEAEIYYRYGGRSEKIKYSELIALIECEQKKERALWMSHIKTIDKFGVENAVVVDSVSRLAQGPKGSFIIPETLIPKLKFITEGKFQEKDGAPTLTVIGEAKIVSEMGVQPIQHHNITSNDILYSFFDRHSVVCPEEFIKRICSEPAAYFPVYFFIKQTSLTKSEVIDILTSFVIRNPSTRNRLIARLQNDNNLQDKGSLNTQTFAGTHKSRFVQKIISKEIPENIAELTEAEVQYFLRAITYVDKNEIDLDYILPILKNVFQKRYIGAKSALAESMRKAVCYIDKLFYDSEP